MFSSQKNPFKDRKDGEFDIHKVLFIIDEFTALKTNLDCIKNPNLLNIRVFGQQHSRLF